MNNKTEIFLIKYDSIDNDILKKCGQLIRDGKLVAFPTETVYGLGGNGLDSLSIKKIYEAKGRPSDNPLILHVSDLCDLDNLVYDVSDKAIKLALKFWPGPLTMIFKKNNIIPDSVTGGMDTVAIRIPENIIARKLIEYAGVPIAAPSANTSGKPSPTEANHVKNDLFGKIEAIIDGGKCQFGLESTIIDMTCDIPIILRPGSITVKMIEDVIGNIQIDKTILENNTENINFKPKAPGMKYKHYSPNAEVFLFEGNYLDIVNKINLLAKNITDKKIGILSTTETFSQYDNNKYFVINLGDKDNLLELGANLFSAFRTFDDNSIDIIFSETFATEGHGLALMNRMLKSAGFNITKC